MGSSDHLAVKDTATAVDFLVVDSDGLTPVTGLTGFTPKLYNPSGAEVSGSITVTTSELGDGWYRSSLTPNATGKWALSVAHATRGIFEGSIHVFEQLFDEVGPGVGDRTVEITVQDGATLLPIAGATVRSPGRYPTGPRPSRLCARPAGSRSRRSSSTGRSPRTASRRCSTRSSPRASCPPSSRACPPRRR